MHGQGTPKLLDLGHGSLVPSPRGSQWPAWDPLPLTLLPGLSYLPRLGLLGRVEGGGGSSSHPGDLERVGHLDIPGGFLHSGPVTIYLNI